jgi:hypothetical protein
VVGYVNVTTVGGQFALVANPLDNGTNNLPSLLPNVPNGSQVQVWNGSGFTVSSKNPPAGNWNTPLTIPPGTGFFLRTPSAQTNTFVGNVIVGPGGTNSTSLPGGVFSLVGSAVPFSGLLTDAGQNTLNLGPSVPNATQVQVWNGTGFTVISKNPPLGTWSSNPTISVGQGFFIRPPITSTWSQSLSAQ